MNIPPDKKQIVQVLKEQQREGVVRYKSICNNMNCRYMQVEVKKVECLNHICMMFPMHRCEKINCALYEMTKCPLKDKP